MQTTSYGTRERRECYTCGESDRKVDLVDPDRRLGCASDGPALVLDANGVPLCRRCQRERAEELRARPCCRYAGTPHARCTDL